MAEIDIEIALEPDALEMTFDLGGIAPQPAPEPSGGSFIAGNVLVTTSGIVAAAPYIAGSVIPSYDETKITAMILNENDEPGEVLGVYDSLLDVQNALASQYGAGRRFYVHIGENAGITTMGAPNAGGQGTISGITSPFRVRIPQSVTAMNINTFSNSTGLMMPVILPEHLTTIGNSAFGNCPRITSVTIPGSVTSIHEFAFYACPNLTEITINKPSGSISGSPWGATNATVVWTG